MIGFAVILSHSKTANGSSIFGSTTIPCLTLRLRAQVLPLFLTVKEMAHRLASFGGGG